MINEEDQNKIIEILDRKIINTDEVLLMEQLMIKYVDDTTTICKSCPAQIRFAFNRLKLWFERYKKNNLANKKCIVCGKEMINVHFNKKYCSDECKQNK